MNIQEAREIPALATILTLARKPGPFEYSSTYMRIATDLRAKHGHTLAFIPAQSRVVRRRAVVIGIIDQ
jgi:hypothetical protein